MTNMGTTGREREISWFCKRYENSNRREKGELLSEIETRFLVSRRHAKRLMIGDLCSEAERKTKTGKIGRPSKYQDKAFLDALRFMWKTTRFMCSRHLKSAMPAWLPYVEMEHECFLPEVREKLLTVSAPTIDRLLKRYRAKRGKSFTRPGVFREEIPIQENIWDINVPGFLESDTVAHCGGSLAGEFVYSLTLVDIATLWTETRAVFGKG
ncbi:MAG: integrase, partial [Deltaproteobacteria bacterium]|nr:integrase [Deltaproteobacteria bacterium]